MDATEFNQYDSRPLRPEQYHLPAIKDLRIRIGPFDPPKFKHLKSHLEKYKEALEITIVTEGPIPARGATPVLLIDGAKISYYSLGKNKNEYHFYAFEWQTLKEGAPIQWGWDNDPLPQIQTTKYNFQRPQPTK